jgi:hypothetical protein
MRRVSVEVARDTVLEAARRVAAGSTTSEIETLRASRRRPGATSLNSRNTQGLGRASKGCLAADSLRRSTFAVWFNAMNAGSSCCGFHPEAWTVQRVERAASV